MMPILHENTSPRCNEHGQPIGEPVADWTARPRPPPTPMVGRTCRVVPTELADADALWDAYSADPSGRSWTYLFVDLPPSREAFRERLGGLAASTDPFFHSIVTTDANRPVGVAAFMRIDPGMGVIEVGNINYSEALKRTIAATECMFLMMRRVFDELGYRRYEWKCDSLNHPSRRAAERLGFTYEGTFRQAVVYKGRNRDTAWYSIIDREWPQLRSAYERWLDPSNFDADGQQRAGLAEMIRTARHAAAG